jgi:hypothetical protein
MATVLIRKTPREAPLPEAANRRAGHRYAVTIPLRYRPAGGIRHSAWRRGRSLDMSATGIRIQIPEAARPGSRWELLMEWPGLYHGAEMVHLFLLASVTRADRRGVALRILSHRFLTPAVDRSGSGANKRAVA